MDFSEINLQAFYIDCSDKQYRWRIKLTYQGRTFDTEFKCGLGHAKLFTEPHGKARAFYRAQIEAQKLGSTVLGATAEQVRALKYGERLSVSDVEDSAIVPTPPTLNTVLQCLQSDAQSGEHMLFEDFCDDFGYDTDSRKAEAIWRACQEVHGKLQKLFRGEGFEAFMSRNYDEEPVS